MLWVSCSASSLEIGFPPLTMPPSRPARQRMGLGVSVPDGQIVAIARSRGAEGIVTRNLRDFAQCGLKLIDPWTAARR
jgi:toxin FitB